MCAYSGNNLSSNAWQATAYGISRNLRGALQLIANSSAMSHQQEPKKLTNEAIYMILFLLAFVILTLIGSSIDLYEYLRNEPTRKKLPGTLQKKTSTNGDSCSEDEEKLSETTVWKKIWKPFLSCFSVQKNWEIFFNFSFHQDHIACFDFVKIIGIYLTIQSHIIPFYANTLKNRVTYFVSFIHWNPVPKGLLTVNLFAMISGFLIGYSVSRKYHKSKGKISWLSIPLQTFIRFTPAMMIVVGIYAILFPYMGSGPVWPKYDINPVCRENWIWNLFFLNNFLPAEQQCMLPLWYLACLLQLNTISPLLLIPIIRMPKVGYTLGALVSVSSCLTTFILTIKNNLAEDLLLVLNDTPDLLKAAERMWRHFDIIHAKPYTRLSSYSAGIALGCFVHSQRLSNIKKFNLVQLSFGWITCIILLWLCSLGILDSQGSTYEIAAFYSICPLLNACGWAWIIYLCTTDQFGFFNTLMSYKLFKVLGRLSLPAYLLHMFVVDKYFLSFEHLIDHSTLSLAIITHYLYLSILAVSWIYYMIFEIPVLRIHNLCHEIYQKKFHQKMN